MLNRFFVHVCFVLLFAFAQIGMVAHPISHFHDLTTQSQDDKNTTAEHCQQCLSYAHADSAMVLPALILSLNVPHQSVTKITAALLASALTSTYHARAPPFFA